MDSKELILAREKFHGLPTSQQLRVLKGSALHKVWTMFIPLWLVMGASLGISLTLCVQSLVEVWYGYH